MAGAVNQLTRGTALVGDIAVTVDDKIQRVTEIELASASGDGGAFTWANPIGKPIVVDAAVFRVTNASSNSRQLNVGTTDTVDDSDNLIDGAVTNALATFDSRIAGATGAGTNGGICREVDADGYVTGTYSGSPNSFGGTVWLYWHEA